MEKKIYVVQVSMGEYEDHNVSVDCVLDNEISAKERVKVITEYYSNLNNIEPPYDEADYFGENLTEEQDAKFSAWQRNKFAAYEFNSAYIETYTLNNISESIPNN